MMPRYVFYLIVLFGEILACGILQSVNYFEQGEIMLRSILSLVTTLIISTALVAIVSGPIYKIIDYMDTILKYFMFSVEEKRGKKIVGILFVTILLNAFVHVFISTKPNVSARYILKYKAEQGNLTHLALMNMDNYKTVAARLKVYINYKNIKKIQKLAIEQMEDQREMLLVAKELSKSYVPGLAQSNGFDVIVTKLRRAGRQDMLFSMYKHIMALNQTSLNFVGGSALSVIAHAIDKKEFLEEISRDKDTPNFIIKIVKSKLKVR